LERLFDLLEFGVVEFAQVWWVTVDARLLNER